MNGTLARWIRYACNCTWVVGITGLGIAAGSPPVTQNAQKKKTETKVARSVTPAKTMDGATSSSANAAQTAPGLPIGPNTNYTVQVPAISIESSSPMMCNVGKPMEHHILVKNIGTIPAEQLEVRAAFSLQCTVQSSQPKAEIDGATLVWKLARLDANAQQKLSVQLKPLTPGELSCNTAVAFRSNSSLQVQVGEPKLKLVCEGPKETLIGSDAHLVLTVINSGTGTAGGVSVRQVLAGPIQASSIRPATPPRVDVGTLEPGESRFLETVAPAQHAGPVRIHLVAECEDGSRAVIEHELTVRAPKLALTSSGPDFRYLNRKANYQMTLRNPGDAPATNVNLQVSVPEGLQFLEATSGGIYDEQRRIVEWSVGIIEAGRSEEFGLTVMAKTEGEHRHRAVAWADNNLRTTSDKSTRVGSTASLVMEVVDLDDPVEIGNSTAYEIRVANRGTKAAEAVRVIADVPDDMQFVSAEGPSKFQVDGQRITFEELPTLATQSVVVFKVRVKGTKAATVRFRAELSSRSLNHALSAEQVTEIYGE